MHILIHFNIYIYLNSIFCILHNHTFFKLSLHLHFIMFNILFLNDILKMFICIVIYGSFYVMFFVYCYDYNNHLVISSVQLKLVVHFTFLLHFYFSSMNCFVLRSPLRYDYPESSLVWWLPQKQAHLLRIFSFFFLFLFPLSSLLYTHP